MQNQDLANFLDLIARRLNLHAIDRASDADLERLEEQAGEKLPSGFKAFLRRFNGCTNSNLQFDDDAVFFDPVVDVLEELRASQLENMGVIPFAHDPFAGLWLLALRTNRFGARAGRVEFIAVEPRHVNHAEAVEHRSPTFESFLEGVVAKE